MKNFFLLLVLTSCNFISDNNSIPDDIISENKMTEILYDMSLISVSKGINKKNLENNGLKPKKYILDKYSIDSLQFVLSNEYYSKDLEKYLSIYENVLKKLEINRQIIIDSLEKYKSEQSERSNKIIKEDLNKNYKISKPNASKLNPKILKN